MKKMVRFSLFASVLNITGEPFGELEDFVKGEGVSAYGLGEIIPNLLLGFVVEEGGWQFYIATWTKRPLSFLHYMFCLISRYYHPHGCFDHIPLPSYPIV